MTVRMLRRLRVVWGDRMAFKNWMAFERVARLQGNGESVIRTRSGASICIRHNTYDAMVLREQFVSREYLRHFKPPLGRQVRVVDVGGYIGDFALYCAFALDAQVVVYEPASENWRLLTKNLSLNPQVAEQIVAINRAVGVGTQVAANVKVLGNEVHVSSVLYAEDPSAESRNFPADDFESVLRGNAPIDLLKIDIEGGEYDIIDRAPAELLAECEHIVLEWHEVTDRQARLNALLLKLHSAGFSVSIEANLVYASRLALEEGEVL